MVMKKLVLEDLRSCGIRQRDVDFRVKSAENTLEFKVEEFLSEDKVKEVMTRTGTRAVRVSLVKAKGR